MLRTSFVNCLILASCCTAPALAAAQDAEFVEVDAQASDETAPTPGVNAAETGRLLESTDFEAVEHRPGDPVEVPPILLDGSYLFDVGMGLTIGGLSTFALGAVLLGALIGGSGYAGGIAGGVFIGIGTILTLVGAPMWLVGASRLDMTAAGIRREEAALNWEIAGIVTFIGSLLLSGAGIWLTTTGQTPAIISGITMIPIGVASALFVGVPMWAEGARF